MFGVLYSGLHTELINYDLIHVAIHTYIRTYVHAYVPYFLVVLDIHALQMDTIRGMENY